MNTCLIYFERISDNSYCSLVEVGSGVMELFWRETPIAKLGAGLKERFTGRGRIWLRRDSHFQIKTRSATINSFMF
jgi:hypothetical protein